MSLKHNIVFIILGLFLLKIGVVDNARNYQFNRKVASETHYDKGIR